MTEPTTESRASTRGPLIAVVALALIGGGGVLAWGIVGLLSGGSPIGDGRDPGSYGADLSTLVVDREALAGTGNPRDFLRPYEDPDRMPGSEVAQWNADNSRKWQKEVVSTDRVVGIEIDGETRAYPLFIVDAHEIVTDVLGDVPIMIARSPLLDEVMVFDRRLDDGSLVDLGVSGLLEDLALVMHDGREPLSLWSAHDGRAIAGPSVGDRLRPIEGVSIVPWRSWLERHPGTTVVVREPDSMRRYRRIDYRRYLDGDRWLIPPRREPATGSSPGPRDRVVSILGPDGEPHAIIPLADLARHGKRLTVVVDGRSVVLETIPGEAVVRVVSSDGPATRFGMWSGPWTRNPVVAEAALDRGRELLAGAAETP